MTVVGIDVSAVPDDPRGAGRYVVELVKALDRRGTVELRLQSRRNDRERWESIAPNALVRGVVPASRPLRLAWEQVAAPRFVDSWGIDVFHAPHYTMPEIARTPKAVTIHDLTYFDHPEWHKRSKVSFFKRAIRVAAQRADALVCVSDATARRLHDLVDTKADVHVVPHGLDHDAFKPTASSDTDNDDDDSTLRAVGVPAAPFVAFVGTLEPRKDLATLVKAFDVLAATDRDMLLVVAGGKGWGNEPFEKAVAASAHGDRIIRTGYVPDAAVPALFRHAKAVVYPALEEGFGLPVIEALACGAPTITTAGSVMDELAGGAAFTIPPSDAAALAEVLRTVLVGGGDVERRRALGLDVAKLFTWDASAAGHEAVYEAVASRR